jgi:hypothetical protein
MMIRHLVGSCHVGQGYLRVLRYVLSRLVGRRRAFLSLSRTQRHKLVREVFRAHRANRRIYAQVTGGI